VVRRHGSGVLLLLLLLVVRATAGATRVHDEVLDLVQLRIKCHACVASRWTPR
jgi:hypothetical protein